jgi:hypothetical protein
MICKFAPLARETKAKKSAQPARVDGLTEYMGALAT